MEVKEMLTKKQKVTKIVSYVINVISIIIMLFAVIIVVTSLTSRNKGYTSFFGTSYFVVQSNSMKVETNPKADNFQQGDIIAIKIVNENERENLKIGDVITFYDIAINGDPTTLNTHRIKKFVYEVNHAQVPSETSRDDAPLVGFMTQGDNHTMSVAEEFTRIDDVVGVFVGKASGLGQAVMFIQSQQGFLFCVLIPCVLVMLYCGYLVIANIVRYKQRKVVFQHEEDVEDLKEKIRQELLAEMQAKNGATINEQETSTEENSTNSTNNDEDK